jgi:hypothetical protein
MRALSQFVGSWVLSRTIDDRLSGRPGRFDGTATFTPNENGLRYHEEGLLTLADGPPLRATRAYLWRPDGDAVAVLFADGRPFHRFTGTGQGTDHPCGADLYRVLYDFSPWPAWSATWSVSGPAKDYVMRSLYRRP